MGIALDKAPEGARASLTGTVRGRPTYGQWLRAQGAEIQNEALGPARAKLFRKGGLKIEQFTDRKGRAFTLDELRRREADAFSRAA